MNKLILLFAGLFLTLLIVNSNAQAIGLYANVTSESPTNTRHVKDHAPTFEFTYYTNSSAERFARLYIYNTTNTFEIGNYTNVTNITKSSIASNMTLIHGTYYWYITSTQDAIAVNSTVRTLYIDDTGDYTANLAIYGLIIAIFLGIFVTVLAKFGLAGEFTKYVYMLVALIAILMVLGIVFTTGI